MRPSRIMLLVAGVLIGLIGLGMAGGGAALAILAGTQRDAAGYLTSETQRFSTASYALTAQLPTLASNGSGWVHHAVTLRIKAADNGATPLFVGVARPGAIDTWLADVSHDEVIDVKATGFGTSYLLHPGTEPAAPPVALQFWAASASAPGQTTLTWPLEGGSWDVVVMNADAHAGITAEVSAGVKLPALVPVGIGLGSVGLLALALGIVLAALGVSGARTTAPQDAARGVWPGWAGPPVERGTYPVRVNGRLEEPLSRWLWLVKVILVIPHLLVLIFLWIADGVLTVVAWFAILATGRYPRSIFDFNVGVMRWTWRVQFYSFGAFGTDRYPPFTLEPRADYPADLEVDYPEHLSRGLALVKWWLLAFPHYLIVAILAGGLAFFGNLKFAGGGGLIGLLALIAVIVTAVSAHYPRGLFDFLMGLNRWVWRVAAYAGLMRDEYPPFRLDSGGSDPGNPLPVPPPAPVGAGVR